jgi:hypothetical protein
MCNVRQGALVYKEKEEKATCLPAHFFFEIFQDLQVWFYEIVLCCVVFLSLSCICRERKRQKNAIKTNRREKTTGKSFFSQLFWQTVFDMDLPQQVFNGVYELPMLKNSQKRHKKESEKRKKVFTYPI